MCTGRTTRSLPGQISAQHAGQFARGTTAALLSAQDWGICNDVAAAASDMVARVADQIVEVSVTVHRDTVEIIVVGGGVYARREVLANGPFQTPVDCTLS